MENTNITTRNTSYIIRLHVSDVYTFSDITFTNISRSVANIKVTRRSQCGWHPISND